MSPRKHAERITAQVSSDHPPVRQLWQLIIKPSQSKGDVKFSMWSLVSQWFTLSVQTGIRLNQPGRSISGGFSRQHAPFSQLARHPTLTMVFQQWNSGIGHPEQQFRGTALASPLQGANTFAELQNLAIWAFRGGLCRGDLSRWVSKRIQNYNSLIRCGHWNRSAIPITECFAHLKLEACFGHSADHWPNQSSRPTPLRSSKLSHYLKLGLVQSHCVFQHPEEASSEPLPVEKHGNCLKTWTLIASHSSALCFTLFPSIFRFRSDRRL